MAIDIPEHDGPTSRQQHEQPVSNLVYNMSFGQINIYDDVEDLREDAAGEDGILSWSEAPGYMWGYAKVLTGNAIDGITDAISDAIQGFVYSVMVALGSVYRMAGHIMWSVVNMAINPREEGYIGNLMLDPAYAPAVRVYCRGKFGDTNIVFHKARSAIWNSGTAPTLRVEVLPAIGNYINGTFAEEITDQKTHFYPYSLYEVSL